MMSDVPRYRVRAYSSTLNRRRRERRAPGEPPSAGLCFRRVQAELLVAQGPTDPPSRIPARIVLSEFGPEGVTLFASSSIEQGREVRLLTESPIHLSVAGRVSACKFVEGSSRVLAQQAYSFRMRIEFAPASEEEREAVKAYCEELARMGFGPGAPATGSKP